MREITSTWRDRLERLHAMCGQVELLAADQWPEKPLIALTSSRLGRRPLLHYLACQFLQDTCDTCRRLGAGLLIGSGTAIEPWAARGAELFGVPCYKLGIGSNVSDCRLIAKPHASAACTVDGAVIALADRVDAAYVRRGGRIAKCLNLRLKHDCDALVRVAITQAGRCAGAELIRAGAVGWIAPGIVQRIAASNSGSTKKIEVDWSNQPADCWGRTEGDWLVHCTRASLGPWPQETIRQYRDSMLLGFPPSTERGPLEALLRIIRSGRIVPGAVASDHHYPVVCFSARSLEDLLSRRCFRPHLGRWDYEPFGIAIRLGAAQQAGIQPVIYGDKVDVPKLPEKDRYRFHPRGTTFDWTLEQEWRSRQAVELDQFAANDVRVFALDSPEARIALADCKWSVLFLRAAAAES